MTIRGPIGRTTTESDADSARLIAVARERGVKRLVGQVLAENAPMLRLLHSLGFSPPVPVENQVVRVEMELTAAAPR